MSELEECRRPTSGSSPIAVMSLACRSRARIYNLLAVGRPVIVTTEAGSEAALILKEENIGWVARPEDPLDPAEAIRSAAANPEETLARGQRAALVAQRYTYDRAIASYRQVISDVMHSSS